MITVLSGTDGLILCKNSFKLDKLKREIKIKKKLYIKAKLSG